MGKRVRPSIMQTLDAQVATLVSESRGVSELDGLRLFLGSKTHEMLQDDDLKMWHYSPLALFDMWEAEVETGDPGNSLYLRGDEVG